MRHIVLSIILTCICFSLTKGQNYETVIILKKEALAKLVEETPQIATDKLWGILDNNSEVLLKKQKNQEAFVMAEKAEIIAKYLKPQTQVKTYQRLVKISSILQTDSKVIEYFVKYIESLKKEFELVKPNKPKRNIDDGYTLYYFAKVNSDPFSTNTNIYNAIKSLETSYQLSNLENTPKSNELYILTTLQLSRCFAALGNKIARVIWLEKSKEKLMNFSAETVDRTFLNKFSELYFQITHDSVDAFRGINDNKSAYFHLNKLHSLTSQISKDSYLLYLFLLSGLNEIADRKEKEFAINKGIQLSVDRKKDFFLTAFYIRKLYFYLQEKNINVAETEKYLDTLETIYKKKNEESFDWLVAKGFIDGINKKTESSKEYFARAHNIWEKAGKGWGQGIVLLAYQAEVAKFNKQFIKWKNLSQELLDFAIKTNGKEFIPYILLNLSLSNYFLGNLAESKSQLEEIFRFVESNRSIDSPRISVISVEEIFEAYQLYTDIYLTENKISEAFQSSEKLKARWLNDKINGNPLNQKVYIDQKLKTEIFDLSVQILKNPKDEELFTKLSELEKKAIFYENDNQQTNELSKPNNNLLNDLEKSSISPQTAIISYAFTNDGKLNAFVWQKGKSLEVKQLPITKDESDQLAKEIHKKIKESLFFKKEGKVIYDKLLKPLNLQAKHLIIIPDKSLWKIPFQALSEDGKTYLIENKTISYAPSVSILVNQLNYPPPNRQTFQVFSNALYNNLYLLYADAEANKLAKLFGVQPKLNSTVATFANSSNKSDIVHFSMHAEADNDEAFNSFLAFKPVGKNDGKLTVNELLKMKLKKGSLVFLASCVTDNVFNGEGLVSLAWGMMGAGASTVISAQWEANDKSTGQFTQAFYKHYKQGISSAEALQKASIEMINNSNSKMSEPFYWAEFTLNGDFR